jgi:dynein heavy chain
MNSLMDDNKLLTLANGERISLSVQVTLLFETEDLSTASPATVSRAGIVYCDYEKLGWKPYFESWLKQKTSQVNLKNKHSFRVVNKLSQRDFMKPCMMCIHIKQCFLIRFHEGNRDKDLSDTTLIKSRNVKTVLQTAVYYYG